MSRKTAELRKAKAEIRKLRKSAMKLARIALQLQQEVDKVWVVRNGVMVESHPADGC